MADEKRMGLIGFFTLLLIVAGAAGVRVGYLWLYADQARNAGPLLVQDPSPVLVDLPAGTEMRGKTGDIRELDALVHNIKEHSWFGSLAPFAAGEEQTAHVSPGYPWLVANVARLVPAEQLEPVLRWGQAGLGALTVGLIFLFARRAFGSFLVAVLAGVLAAVYPFWVVGVAEMADGVLASFMLALALYLGVVASQTGGPVSSLFYGLSLAGLSLVRAVMLPFSFIALAWFLLRSRAESRSWLCGLLACLGFFNGLAPWTVRSFQAFQEIVPVVDSAWLHLWIGNNPQATGGPPSAAMWASAPGDELAAVKSQPARYGKLAPVALQEIEAHPEKTLERRYWAALYFFLGEHFFTRKQLAEPTGTGVMPPATSVTLWATLLGLLLLAFLGWRWSYAWKREAMPSSLAMIWIPLPYLLSHAAALHGPRLPLDGLLLCYAAFALVALVPGLGRRLRNPTLAERRGTSDE